MWADWRYLPPSFLDDFMEGTEAQFWKGAGHWLRMGAEARPHHLSRTFRVSRCIERTGFRALGVSRWMGSRVPNFWVGLGDQDGSHDADTLDQLLRQYNRVPSQQGGTCQEETHKVPWSRGGVSHPQLWLCQPCPACLQVILSSSQVLRLTQATIKLDKSEEEQHHPQAHSQTLTVEWWRAERRSQVIGGAFLAEPPPSSWMLAKLVARRQQIGGQQTVGWWRAKSGSRPTRHPRLLSSHAPVVGAVASQGILGLLLRCKRVDSPASHPKLKPLQLGRASTPLFVQPTLHVPPASFLPSIASRLHQGCMRQGIGDSRIRRSKDAREGWSARVHVHVCVQQGAHATPLALAVPHLSTRRHHARESRCRACSSWSSAGKGRARGRHAPVRLASCADSMLLCWAWCLSLVLDFYPWLYATCPCMEQVRGRGGCLHSHHPSWFLDNSIHTVVYMYKELFPCFMQ